MKAVVVLHVADRVDVHQERHDGDDDEHRRGQRIDQGRDVRVELPDADPFVEADRRVLPAAVDLEEHEDRQQRREAHRGGGDRPGRVAQVAAAKEPVDEECRERERRDEPDQVDRAHPFIAFAPSTSTDGRLR